jgi:hypothetical protein
MKQVIIICYPNDWHWVLSAEFIKSHSAEIDCMEVWDLSWAGESGLKSYTKRIFGGNKLHRESKRWLKDQNIRIRSYASINRSKQRAWIEYNNSVSSYPYLDFSKHRTIFNTVVEEVGNLKVDTELHRSQVFQQLHASFVVKTILERLEHLEISRVITVNGRFTKNATVRDWAHSKNLPLVLLEFGSTKETIEEFNVSPHSVLEVTKKIFTYWNAAEKDYRVHKASKYLDSLLRNEVSEIQWREKMLTSELPPFPRDKKVCVFFASTESEEAGLGDSAKEGEFKSQVEAFSGLLKILPEKEWHIFLRRHPRDPQSIFANDPEEHLWTNFAGVNNVSVIEPESSVDSIELGLRADLVANYWSTISIELLARGKTRVITLGDAPWNQMVPTNSTRTPAAIEEFLNNGDQEINVECLYPWAFYYATFGKQFELFRFDTNLKKWAFKNF